MEEEAKKEYFRVIAEKEKRGYKRKTVAELIAEESMAKQKETDRLNNLKKEEEETKRKEIDNKEAEEEAKNTKKETYEEANYTKGSTDVEKADRDELKIEGEKAVNTFDSFTPQEFDLSSMQESSGKQSSSTQEMDKMDEESSGQQSSSTKEMDEMDEEGGGQQSSSTKEMDEMDEVDISKQVKEDE